MATATFIQNGAALDYTPGTDVAAGTVVVQTDLVGIAKLDIKAGELGALHVEGVFEVPKATGGGSGLTAGTKVYWDIAEQVAKADDESGANRLLGKVVLTAGDVQDTVKVRLSQ